MQLTCHVDRANPHVFILSLRNAPGHPAGEQRLSTTLPLPLMVHDRAQRMSFGMEGSLCTVVFVYAELCSKYYAFSVAGTIALGDVIKLFDAETLKRLKSECGGMQTLLRNNHQLFHGQCSESIVCEI